MRKYVKEMEIASGKMRQIAKPAAKALKRGPS